MNMYVITSGLLGTYNSNRMPEHFVEFGPTVYIYSTKRMSQIWTIMQTVLRFV